MTLLELLRLLRKHLRLVVTLPIVCAVVMALGSVLFMNDEYTATTTMYVYSTDISSSSTSNNDLSASQMVANDVSTLLTSERVTADTAEQIGLDDLDDFDISVESETTTRVITLSVTGTNAEEVAEVANGLASNVSTVASEVMNVESVNVIDTAPTPTEPSGPNRVLYVAVAFIAGLFVAVAIVVLLDILDTRIRGAEDVEQLLGIPVIGRIPEMKGRR